MPETILVTGGAGFIGSHLCEALLAQGHEVLCLDNFCSFYPPEIKRKNIQPCLEQPNFTLIEADITAPEALAKVFNTNHIDLVIHLAARAGVRPSIRDPLLYAQVNFLGTQNLLELCAAHRIGKFIFASSSSVYGNKSQVPFVESDPVDMPISPYAATKKAGELLCHTWHHLHRISMLCLRFFTVYGPRQRPDLAIHKFTELLARGKALPVYGDGSSSRDYTYISDIIGGILGAVEYARNHHCYEIINLGSDHGIRLDELIGTLERVSGLPARLERKEPQPGDVLRTHADISKARQLLGYAPAMDFQEGIRLFWQWWQSSQT